MQLLAAHQLLIGSAIALAVIFGLRSMAHFSHGGGATDAVLGVVSILAAGALSVYFRKLRVKWIALRKGGGR